MIETTILNVVGTTMVLGCIAFALAVVQREWTQSRKRVKAQREIDAYCELANEMAFLASEDGVKLSRDDLQKIRELFEEMCPTAHSLGMYVNNIKLKDDE